MQSPARNLTETGEQRIDQDLKLNSRLRQRHPPFKCRQWYLRPGLLTGLNKALQRGLEDGTQAKLHFPLVETSHHRRADLDSACCGADSPAFGTIARINIVFGPVETDL